MILKPKDIAVTPNDEVFLNKIQLILDEHLSDSNFNSDTFSTYYIYVYGFGTEIGDFTLDISCIPLISPPTNDLCNDAIPVNCGDSISGSTDEATINNAPLAFCGTGNGAPGIWYVIDGTGDDINVSLCGSSFDTKIQVYEGGCDALTCIGGNDDACGLQSDFSFRSDTFSSYYIYVYGFGTMTGDFTLDITCTPPPPLPTNDDCSSASLIGCGDSVSGTTVGATIVDAPLVGKKNEIANNTQPIKNTIGNGNAPSNSFSGMLTFLGSLEFSLAL